MVDYLINLIMSKADVLAFTAICIPLFAGLTATVMLIADGALSNFIWYNRLVFGQAKYDEIASEEFFGRIFIATGLANIITPCVVIYIYLTLTNTPLSVFWNSWRT